MCREILSTGLHNICILCGVSINIFTCIRSSTFIQTDCRLGHSPHSDGDKSSTPLTLFTETLQKPHHQQASAVWCSEPASSVSAKRSFVVLVRHYSSLSYDASHYLKSLICGLSFSAAGFKHTEWFV